MVTTRLYRVNERMVSKVTLYKEFNLFLLMNRGQQQQQTKQNERPIRN
jgi:hypothetical protein